MILIYSQQPGPRLSYAAEVIFRWVLKLKIPVMITQEADEFMAFNGRKICYSEFPVGGGIHIVPSGFLSQQGVKPVFPGITDSMFGKALFPVEGSEDFNFDVFSAVFYTVSRYEEYLPFEPDQHGRFKPESSFAYQHGMIDKPMVHYWSEELKDKLMLRFNEFPFPKKKFRIESTIDVDNGYAYLGKGIRRTFGGYAKDLLRGRFRSVIERTHVLTGNKKDPFNHYKFHRLISKKLEIPLRYFILAGDRSSYDGNIETEGETFRKLVRRLKKFSKVGIHPSYYSGESTAVLEKEIKRLEKVLGKKVTSSRQHFLKMTLPETYRRLIKSGIRRDYSMGYAGRPGFRAGIAEPFPFYDVQEDKRTSLMIRPFQVMETTYRDYLRMNPSQALQEMENVMMEVKKVSGLFISVWHDRSFSNWAEHKGWKEVYTELHKTAVQK